MSTEQTYFVPSTHLRFSTMDLNLILTESQIQTLSNLIERDSTLNVAFFRDANHRNIFESKLQTLWGDAVEHDVILKIFDELHDDTVCGRDDIALNGTNNQRVDIMETVVETGNEVERGGVADDIDDDAMVIHVQSGRGQDVELNLFNKDVLGQNDEVMASDHGKHDTLSVVNPSLVNGDGLSVVVHSGVSRRSLHNHHHRNEVKDEEEESEMSLQKTMDDHFRGQIMPIDDSKSVETETTNDFQMLTFEAFKESLSAEDIAKIALLLMEETFGDKIFNPLRLRLSAMKLTGSSLLKLVDSASTEQEFLKFFCLQIHKKCGQFAVDLYRDLKASSSSMRQHVDSLSSTEALSKWMVDELSHRICSLMEEEAMNGRALCEFEKNELVRKLSKYLKMGPALKLIGNLERHLEAAHQELQQKKSSEKEEATRFKRRRLSESMSRGVDSMSTIGAVLEDEELHESFRTETLTFRTETDFDMKYSTTLTKGLSADTESQAIKSMDPQTRRMKQEQCELATFAADWYQSQHQRSLKQCRQNMMKCDLTKLLPHLLIDDELDFQYFPFLRGAKVVYGHKDRDCRFYEMLFHDIKTEDNGFSNKMSEHQMREWMAEFELNRIRWIFAKNEIDFRRFRLLSKHKMRDNEQYLGFLPEKRRKRLYKEMDKFLNSKQ